MNCIRTVFAGQRDHYYPQWWSYHINLGVQEISGASTQKPVQSRSPNLVLTLWCIPQGSLAPEGVQSGQSLRQLEWAKATTGNESVVEILVSNIIHVISQSNFNPWVTYIHFT